MDSGQMLHHSCSLKWIDSFMEELAFDSRSSGDGSDATGLEDWMGTHPADTTERDALIRSALDQLSDEEKKRRHRESMARLRGERRSSIKQLEVQERALLRRLRKALATQDLHSSDHNALAHRCRAYAQLVQTSELLRQEQYVLENELHARERYSKLAATERERVDEQSQNDIGLSDLIDDPRGHWTRFFEHELPLFYENETLATCAAATDRSRNLIDQIRRTLSDASSTVCNGQYLGWEARQVVVDTPESSGRPALRFQFTRKIPRTHSNLTDLEHGTWAMLQSPALMMRMYGSSCLTRTVQVVSEDAFVLLRNSPIRIQHRHLRYFNLNSRVRSRDSVSVLMTILDKEPTEIQRLEPERVEGERRSVTWLKQGAACLRFSHCENEIEMEYIGQVECVNHDHATRLLIECCASLMRWENIVLSPRLIASE